MFVGRLEWGEDVGVFEGSSIGICEGMCVIKLVGNSDGISNN